MTTARLLYSLLLYLAAPLLLLRLLWRGRRQRAYLRHIPERFGFYADAGKHRYIWLHAVSVGETRAVEPLVRALQAHYPQHRILLTHMTPTGRETGVSLFGDSVTRCYLPYDYPGATRRFLEHFRPEAGLLIETEVWPNLIAAGVRCGIPLHLINARLSERSLRGYRKVGALACDALRGFSLIAAQTEADATRLLALKAARVVVTGNLKFDVDPPAQQVATGVELKRTLGSRPVLLAASTREGEEELLLDGVRRSGLDGALLIIVPRHPQRFDAVATMVAERGLHMQRRSAGGPVDAATDVLLGDTMGEMFMYYAACDVVLMGGSFLSYGAHSLIEPCAAGKPVIIGPSTYNFAEATDAAVAAGAALRVDDMERGLAAALELASDTGRCRRMGDSGLAFTAAHRGAAKRVLELIQLRAING
jgi:3-deoxy-D-manno-octulosonic-acid transferase